jgi:hypothetical protein
VAVEHSCLLISSVVPCKSPLLLTHPSLLLEVCGSCDQPADWVFVSDPVLGWLQSEEFGWSVCWLYFITLLSYRNMFQMKVVGHNVCTEVNMFYCHFLNLYSHVNEQKLFQ